LIPKTFSASAMQTFMDCAAQYFEKYINRAQELSGSAASLGTVCHEAIELWLTGVHHERNYVSEWSVMKAFYDEAYWRLFTDGSRYDEGAKLLQNWLARQNWEGRTILCVEEKKSFQLPTSVGPIQFNFIMDRMDQLSDGSIEVIDEKTLSRPLQPEDLKRKLQARIYALAAQLEFPDVERIWVTFDMLRYDPIGIVFTKEENRATWLFLRRLAEQIIASDGTEETINETCRWCIRKTICTALQTHAAAGGTLGITNTVDAAERLYRLTNQVGGLKAEMVELEKIIIGTMREEDLEMIETDKLEVSVTISGRRSMDAERLRTVVGDDIVAKYGNITVGAVEQILKNEPLDPAKKSLIRQLYKTTYGEPSVKFKAKDPF
jgi:RecB family exonuclease